MKRFLPVLALLVLLALPLVVAEPDFDKELSDEEKAEYDAILAPVMKVYDFVKYGTTVAGVLMLVFAGVTFVTAGGEQAKKQRAKNMVLGVVIGLIIIWAAPAIVGALFG
ncbi:hypothetical protein CL622_01605 [archaeon]|nr:hypothetical protein [archaeon]|tara:strand:- start:382 stop:711 length:330 start_codon:yes stop_codon:yes gene_type:complete